MKSKLTITIKKRTQPGWLVWLIIVLPFLLPVLNELLGLPWALRYLLDAAWFALLLLMLCFQRLLDLKAVKGLLGWISLFLLYTAAVYVVEFQSPLYYLWGARNNFRFFIAFLAFALFLTPRDVEDYLKLFDKLFWVNVFVSLVQFFVLGFEGDYLGGIFGTEKGGNAYTNIFFVIVVAKSLLFYLDKKENAWACVSKCGTALVVAALAELKFFFAEFVLILMLAVLFTNFSWRKFWVIVGGLAAVVGCAALLVVVFPSFQGFFTVGWLYEHAVSDSGYTSSGDLNRLNAISQINELWLTNWGQRLFGLGLGNCDTSSFVIVNTPFFEANGDMHYTWMSYAFMYLECGWIGLVFYFGFFVLVYLRALRTCKHSEGIAKTYCCLTRIMSVCCMMIAIYNPSLRTEAAYMAYFVLAIPFVFDREKNANRERVRYAEKSAAEHSLQGKGVLR
ncbi:MAG: hypothetical protein J6B95_00585 [Oscillospiraceae bacterium]|nr:hypothetical protein [Oscillospiraceae bacterium]